LKKYLLILSGILILQTTTFGQAPDTTLVSDKNIRNKVLSDIQDNLDKKTKNIDQTLSRLDSKVDSLDVEIAASRDARDKADKLLQRVQALEQKQQAIEENELYVYQANYQSAIINLVSMDKEIKPLLLFNSAKNFFATLSGNITSATPIAGPVFQALFIGINDYVNTQAGRRKELKEQSMKMFLLTAKLGEFNYDKDLIEQQWEIVTKDLEKLQELGVKLDAMSDTFDSAFDPTEYINSATRMYLEN
jgi:DNA repair exonuclease SbcCD ATPase subunit